MKFTAASPGEPGLPVLVRYRRVGPGGRVGYGVDQRLTVFESGLVELDERHRGRDPTWLALERRDLDRLIGALTDIPKRRWSVGPSLTLSQARTRLSHAIDLREDLGTFHFQLRRGRRRISGEAGARTDLMAVALLDGLRWHAIDLAESLQPTR